MQHLNKWNHFKFKPKIDLALYENWGMSWFGWMKVYDLAKRIFFCITDFFPHLNNNIASIIWWFGNLVDWSLIHSNCFI